LKSIEIDKLHMKFSALNVDFKDPSLDFIVQGNLPRRASESGIPIKGILPLLASLS